MNFDFLLKHKVGGVSFINPKWRVRELNLFILIVSWFEIIYMLENIRKYTFVTYVMSFV